MKKALVLAMLVLGGAAYAQEEVIPDETPAVVPQAEAAREPAAVKNYAGKRTYPGGADEEDLQVQSRLPDAALKTDTRTLQRDVYKTLYNQEMKEERSETVEE